MSADIKIANDKKSYAYCAAIRALVFVHEQNCDLRYEFEDDEDDYIHYLMMLGDKPIATARHRMIDQETGQIGRIVVLKDYRGQGYGREIVSHLTDDLKEKPGIKKIIMSAQDYALPFYAKLGYEAVGDGYLEAGIPHHKIEMMVDRRIRK